MADWAAGAHAAAALSGSPRRLDVCLDSMPRRSRGRELVAVNFPSRLALQSWPWMDASFGLLVKGHVLLGLFLPFYHLFTLVSKVNFLGVKKSELSFFIYVVQARIGNGFWVCMYVKCFFFPTLVI